MRNQKGNETRCGGIYYIPFIDLGGSHKMFSLLQTTKLNISVMLTYYWVFTLIYNGNFESEKTNKKGAKGCMWYHQK